MAKFRITADVKVEVWQNCTFEVEAESLEQAKEIIKADSQSTCVGFETLTDTEQVLFVDVDGENFTAEEI